MVTEKKVKITGYVKNKIVCNKCKRSVSVETDYLTETKAKTLHKCKILLGGNYDNL